MGNDNNCQLSESGIYSGVAKYESSKPCGLLYPSCLRMCLEGGSSATVAWQFSEDLWTLDINHWGWSKEGWSSESGYWMTRPMMARWRNWPNLEMCTIQSFASIPSCVRACVRREGLPMTQLELKFIQLEDKTDWLGRTLAQASACFIFGPKFSKLKG